MAILTKEIEILVIEDNPGDYLLIEEYLLEKVDQPELSHVETLAETVDILQSGASFDAILLDLSLPDASGESLVERVVKLAGHIPVIVLTGYENEEFGLKTLNIGIADYLLKDELNPFLLSKSISYSMERSRINRSLKTSEQKYRDIFNLSPQPMWVYDLETLAFLDVNKAAVDHYGYSRDEFLEMTLKDIRPKQDIPKLEEAVKHSRDEEQLYFEGVFRHLTKDGEIINVEVKSNIIEYRGRRAEMVLANDITEQLKAEQQLAHSEQRFRSLVQDGSDLIAILDTEYKYKYVAPSHEMILGIPAKEFIDNSVLDYIHKDDRKRLDSILSRLAEQEQVEIEPYRFRDSSGQWRWMETIVTNMLENPAVEGFVANSRDITENIERERKLKESVDRYDIVAKATSDTIWDLDLENDRVEYNNNIYSMFGYDRQEVDEVGKWWRDKIHPEDRATVLNMIDKVLAENIDRFQMEYRFQASDGTYKYIYDRAFLVTDDEDKPIRMIGAMQNITQQKEEQEWLKLFESAISTTTESVAIIEAEPTNLPGRKILYINKAFKEMTGYSEEDVINKQSLHILNGPKTSQEQRNKLRESMERWESCEAEFINYKKNGEEFWIHVSMAPVQDTDGEYSNWICVGRDITSRKEHEEELQESLKEKETLLLEVHHRVKNNLAIVSGMMQLQAFQEDNEYVKEKLNDSVSRIKTMGSIHELLYQSSNFSRIKIDQNIRHLISNLTDTFQLSIDLDIEYNLQPIELNINQAIPCSLILNEVVTNIFKHAFKERNTGTLSVDLSEQSEEIHIEIKDNGRGLPDDFETASRENSLGLTLIDTLTNQLDAEYVYRRLDPGVSFTLSFQKAEVKGIGNIHL